MPNAFRDKFSRDTIAEPAKIGAPVRQVAKELRISTAPAGEQMRWPSKYDINEILAPTPSSLRGGQQ
ncbi:hypothetical protein [Mycobacterium sp.]|uniref:hypothetical protein n=1 Tax=Mycobacterium sp. TaxID=1785 RepID=UPI003BACC9E3